MNGGAASRQISESPRMVLGEVNVLVSVVPLSLCLLDSHEEIKSLPGRWNVAGSRQISKRMLAPAMRSEMVKALVSVVLLGL